MIQIKWVGVKKKILSEFFVARFVFIVEGHLEKALEIIDIKLFTTINETQKMFLELKVNFFANIFEIFFSD